MDPGYCEIRKSLSSKGGRVSYLSTHREGRGGGGRIKRNSPRGQTSGGVGKQSQKQRGFNTAKIGIFRDYSQTLSGSESGFPFLARFFSF